MFKLITVFFMVIFMSIGLSAQVNNNDPNLILETDPTVTKSGSLIHQQQGISTGNCHNCLHLEASNRTIPGQAEPTDTPSSKEEGGK